MDFNLKQWRDESKEEDQEAPAPSSAKLPRLLLSNPQHHHHPSPALPLFVPEPTTTATTALPPYSSDNTSISPSAAKFPRMGSYFSLAQWQELELQALIFRHIIAGAAVPPELLHLVKKSLIISSPYYLSNPLHHYSYAHYHQPLLQSGYWGKAAMDPEPGRCRRTDGKKWRCSRDVVAGQKYCERHMHRGKNRSRKPVEIPTSVTASAAAYGGDNGGGEANSTTQVISSTVGVGIGTPRFSISGPLTSMDLHLNRRPLDSTTETKCTFEAQNDGPIDSNRTLRRFFDDWPRSLHDTDNAANSATNLSISMPGNPSSDFSLKLGTGHGDEPRASGERDGPQLNWGMMWDANRVGPMGGPLAEALRSSATTSSPTSVLHRLARSSASETSFVSS